MIRKCVVISLVFGGSLGILMNVADLALFVAADKSQGWLAAIDGKPTMTQALAPIQLALAYIIAAKP